MRILSVSPVISNFAHDPVLLTNFTTKYYITCILPLILLVSTINHVVKFFELSHHIPKKKRESTPHTKKKPHLIHCICVSAYEGSPRYRLLQKQYTYAQNCGPLQHTNQACGRHLFFCSIKNVRMFWEAVLYTYTYIVCCAEN